MPLKVGINGFGTIGKRVAAAVALQPDMTLIGVTKTRPSFEARHANEKQYPLYVAGSGDVNSFEKAGIHVAGKLNDLLTQVDVMVDATPEKIGREHVSIYESAKVPVIFQGGEKADVAEVSFNALGNYAAAIGKHRVRVVSCNTTGLARAAAAILKRYGVEHWETTLIRRAADPSESKKGPINGILPTFKLPSHHGPDVKTIFPELSIATTAVVVPTTLMHVHVNHVRFHQPPRDTADLLEAFRATPRFHLFREWEGVDGTPQAMEYAKDRGLGYADMMENVVWENGVKVDGKDAYFFQAIHQESVVVPENIDALRAVGGLTRSGEESIAKTDKALGLARS
jgi:glyceraldehyde-3-phosphate dehydrogenase (NAD(P))